MSFGWIPSISISQEFPKDFFKKKSPRKWEKAASWLPVISVCRLSCSTEKKKNWQESDSVCNTHQCVCSTYRNLTLWKCSYLASANVSILSHPFQSRAVDWNLVTNSASSSYCAACILWILVGCWKHRPLLLRKAGDPCKRQKKYLLVLCHFSLDYQTDLSLLWAHCPQTLCMRRMDRWSLSLSLKHTHAPTQSPPCWIHIGSAQSSLILYMYLFMCHVHSICV